ncbi:toll/interleukin-1 receptor domain-containing protein [Ideonella sp. A 288]|uniref:toll/interleukin-1 receptor domain-containing protein n=1 Tax=Ideonella sp. A 288 TaxID=1962181 RepID=UPI00130332D8|nr:toll/interleukin-1 receptor domain-containing protein [Ideonella sp. A 288]
MDERIGVSPPNWGGSLGPQAPRLAGGARGERRSQAPWPARSSTLTDSPIPEIYVLWHPCCTIGETLARSIYAWLRPGNGLGPQVYYRSLTEPGGTAGGLPLALPGEQRAGRATREPVPPSSRQVNLQIVILLIDDHMIADMTWRHWLTALARDKPAVRRAFVPVALDSTAYNVPAPLRELNFLRPAGLPLTEPEGARRDAALEASVRSMLKQLTETLCRTMLTTPTAPATGDSAGQGSLPKISIFLSHAKADGTTPAKRIRDHIYSQTQLTAFYDENDIPFGSVFAQVLQSNVASKQTAAMIAVRTERYASRPWCRRELSLFRRPWQEPLPAAMTTEHWRLHPMVIVDALEPGRQTLGVPEFGNATAVRWSDSLPDQEETIVTLVLRDALLAAFHAALGRSLKLSPGTLVLNWLPDPTTLLHIPKVRDGLAEVQLLHPGRGLSGLELAVLDELFPRVSFHCFDQAAA